MSKMSGGYFRHTDSHISIIADDIQHAIETNHEKNEWNESRDYSDETIAKFQIAINQLHKAYAMVRMIDYLLSGDSGEDSFNRQWDNQL